MKIAAAAALGLFAITGCAATGAQPASVASHTQQAMQAPAIVMPDRINSEVHVADLDDTDRMRIARLGSVHASVRVCAAPTGEVSKAELIKSSGNKGLDSAIVSELRAWTYRPYRPTYTSQVCETVKIDYRG